VASAWLTNIPLCFSFSAEREEVRIRRANSFDDEVRGDDLTRT
jgi:hypothetical protein